MCSDNPNLPKEANKARCFVIACLVFAIFSMIGFLAGTPGVIGGIAGILMCVGSSLLICCAPKTVAEGPGKFNAAGVLLLIGGIIQICCAIGTLILMIIIINAVQDSDFCNNHYKSCTTDDYGCSCTGGGASYYNNGNYCDGPPKSADGICWKAEASEWNTNPKSSCSSQQEKDDCNSTHVKDAISGIVAAIMGVCIIFELTVGILGILGFMYCQKAKKAMLSPHPMPSMASSAPVATATATSVPVATATVVASS